MPHVRGYVGVGRPVRDHGSTIDRVRAATGERVIRLWNRYDADGIFHAS